ncbi:MAG: hydroxyacid dehydrogenase [Synergistaceae bacterium]|nr:hydroxyacid dehydrogenase [Synergistaceae bacterium]
MKIVFIDQDYRANVFDGEGLVAPLAEYGEVTGYDDDPCGQEVLYERARGADVMFFKINHLGNDLIDRLAKLKFMQFIGIGYRDYADVPHCASRGITVRGIGEYGSNAVAEFALGLIFNAIRGIPVAYRRMKNHVWTLDGMLGGELALSAVGVVGTGAIGGLVAKKLSLLGARVLAYDIYPDDELREKFGVEYVDIATLMRESDVVSVHLKHTPQTEGLISRELLGMMKRGSYFINTARAQIVDYGALDDFLREGRLAGAAIDVHYSQPPSDWGLYDMENVIATPHMGYYTKIANTNMLRLSVASVMEYLKTEMGQVI